MPVKMKSDNATIARRVDEIFRLRIDGAKRQTILRYTSENGWGVSERQIETYIRRADEMLTKRREKNRELTFALHLARRERLYAEAVKAKDYRIALAILDSDAKLCNLFPDKDYKALRKIAREQQLKIAELEQRFSVKIKDRTEC
jgi:hypothetical protein